MILKKIVVNSLAGKKVKDEQIPTEQEQDQWSAIIILFTLGIIIIGFLGGIYGIQ